MGTIVTRIINDKLDPTRLDDLTVIGVDELSSRRNHNYVTVVVDHTRASASSGSMPSAGARCEPPSPPTTPRP